MQLIGMLDSPYVRRVAVSLQRLGLAFEHRPLSVFRTFDEFRRINPVVKAPTLVCDDGEVLMDSTLILDHAESLAAPGRSLMPHGVDARRQALKLIGLALAACEKSVQIIYERNLRPLDKQHQPWVQRVSEQLQAALEGLEAELGQYPGAGGPALLDQALITAAITWHFVRQTLPASADPVACPGLAALSDRAEALPEFRAAPHGDGVCSGSPAAC
jgi:glutathione S-transferase